MSVLLHTGTHLYSGGGGIDNKLIAWTASGLTPVTVRTDHTAAITALQFRDAFVFSGSEDGTVRVWRRKVCTYTECDSHVNR